MASADSISVSAFVAVLTYYTLAWVLVGRDPARRTIMPHYEPPSGLSPAMIRFLWKQSFDDRAFWSAALSLVARGAVVMQCVEERVTLRRNPKQKRYMLPSEERVLLNRITAGGRAQSITLDMLDEETSCAATRMAEILRRQAVNRWFIENRTYFLVGAALSLVCVAIVARPADRDEALLLLLGLSVMAPAVFYLPFVLLRLRDMFRTIKTEVEKTVLWRTASLMALLFPCLAGILLGSIVLGVTFGRLLIIVLVLLSAVSLIFAKILMAYTTEGRLLVDQIEGFRLFLQSVEKLPLDRKDAPSDQSGLYEKYLPYAVALEVEQSWGDKFLALASTSHRAEALQAAHSFYLGFWNGKPVEMVLKPQGPKGA